MTQIKLFIPPSNYNFLELRLKNAEHWCSKIFDDIKK